eukprot:5527427-Pleurochrysis_carterae.AAC.1
MAAHDLHHGQMGTKRRPAWEMVQAKQCMRNTGHMTPQCFKPLSPAPPRSLLSHTQTILPSLSTRHIAHYSHPLHLALSSLTHKPPQSPLQHAAPLPPHALHPLLSSLSYRHISPLYARLPASPLTSLALSPSLSAHSLQALALTPFALAPLLSPLPPRH